MSGFLTTDVIATAWRKSGAGICVLVEGETDLDDAWYYKQWFGNLARDVTFFPQDGWQQVEVGVSSLRQSLGNKQVYGIIDRDFADAVTIAEVPENGIMRTPKFCLENYLLDPVCWFRYIEPHTRRRQRTDWASPALIQSKIESLYQECVPISAYNWALREARRIDFTAFSALPERERKDRTHPAQLQTEDPVIALHTIAETMKIADDLAAIYGRRLTYLQDCDFERLEEQVNGKFVLNRLYQIFPIQQPLKRNTWDDILTAYMDRCSQPPPDLAALVDAIVKDSRTA